MIFLVQPNFKFLVSFEYPGENERSLRTAPKRKARVPKTSTPKQIPVQRKASMSLYGRTRTNGAKKQDEESVSESDSASESDPASESDSESDVSEAKVSEASEESELEEDASDTSHLEIDERPKKTKQNQEKKKVQPTKAQPKKVQKKKVQKEVQKKKVQKKKDESKIIDDGEVKIHFDTTIERDIKITEAGFHDLT